MNVLMLSNGKIAGNEHLMEFAFDWIAPLVEQTKAKKMVFIPYAMIRGNQEERTQLVRESMSRFGVEVVGIREYEDPIKAIEESDGVIISGGNTWVLNRMLHDQGLIEPIHRAIIRDRKLYIGWSAGTNVATPTIRTTNDMPIISAAILPSLNLVPFQINPHYIEATVSGHLGETREQRIEEFLTVNQSEVVVGIPEGSALCLSGTSLTYHSANEREMVLFRYNQTSKRFASGANCEFLLNNAAVTA